MKPLGFIYKTTCLINGKIYIGRREFSTMYPHENALYLGSGVYFKRALKKYGRKNFKREILKVCKNNEELQYWEHFFIKTLNAQDPNIGYNIADGDVNSSAGNPAHSEIVREKLKESWRHKDHYHFHSEETKKKMSIAQMGKNNNFYGHHHTEETKEKIRQTQKERYGNRWAEICHSRETLLKYRDKINKTLSSRILHFINNSKREIKWDFNKAPMPKGYTRGRLPFSEETKEKLRQWNLGKKYGSRSEETKRLMSQQAIGRRCANNGIHNKWIYDGILPEGYTWGMIKKVS